MRKTLLAFLGVTLLVVSVFSGSAMLDAGPTVNNLILGTTQEPSNLNPWEGSADTKENTLTLIFTGLTYFDQTGVLRPGLATEVPTEANGRIVITRDADGNFVSQSVNWTIRDDANWSDGETIDCNDAEFTFAVQSRDDLPIATRAFSGLVDTVTCDAPDSKSFTIVYNQPNLFSTAIGGSVGLARFGDIAPQHVWQDIVDNVQDPEADFLGAGPATAVDPTDVVGSGPWQLTEWNINQFMSLDRRADYFLTPSGDVSNYVTDVTIRFIIDQPTLLAAIFSGEIDASDDIGLAGQDPAVLAQNLGSIGTVEVTASGFIEKLNFNIFTDPNGIAGLYPDDVDCSISDDLLLWDKRTRQAVIQAVDREVLAPAVFPGAVVSNSFIVGGDIGFNSELNTWPFNPGAASDLLADLGWSDTDGDGILERTTADGREVQFDLPWVATTAAFRVQTGQVLQQDLADVGINLLAENLPGSVVFASEFINHASDCVWGGIFEYAEAGGIGQAPADPLSNELFAFDRNNDPLSEFPDNAPIASNGFSGTNVTGWVNVDFENLRAQALSEFDPAARADIVRDMQVIYNEELPTAPLYDRTETVTLKNGLVNYRKGTSAARTQYVASWCWGWSQNGAVEETC